MNDDKFHPFTFCDKTNVYFLKNFPIKLLKTSDSLISVEQEKVFNELLKDVEQNGIQNPIILEFKNHQWNILLGKKRLQAAFSLNIAFVKAFINIAIDQETDAIKEIISFSTLLQNSDQVVDILGGNSSIDMNCLCLDAQNRLICVGSDHKNWASCELGKSPLDWCREFFS